MDYEPNLPKPCTDALPASAPALDLARYLPEVEAEFASDEEAAEFLRILWDIMCAFVDLGWGVDSIQLAFPDLAKPERTNDLKGSEEA